MTLLLAADVIEGVVVDDEPIVSGVECEASIVEGVELAAEAAGE